MHEWKEREARTERLAQQQESAQRFRPQPTDAELSERRAAREAIHEKRRDVQQRMTALCIDRAHLTDIIGVHGHWKGARADAVRAFCRQLLTDTEEEIKPFSDELKQLALEEVEVSK